MKNIRNDFPFLKNNCVYLDNSSTSLKPKCVIKTVDDFYKKYTSNAFRGNYANSEFVSMKIDECRELLATVIGSSSREIIFTSNCTDSINLLCKMLKINKRKNILCSILEHHSNYLPWVNSGNVITVNVNDKGIIDLKDLENKLSKNKIYLVTVTALSNVTGNVQPIKDICTISHKYGALVNIDCCQYLPHFKIDVKDVDCDFLVMSGHKMCGPSGIGALYVRKELLKKCQIVKYGGGMVDKIIDQNNIMYKEYPYCFEAGTPAIESILGLSSAIRYYLDIGYNNIGKINKTLNDYFIKKINQSNVVESIFPISDKHAPIFTIKFKSNDLNLGYVAKILSDSANICVSSGYQCCQPLYKSINEKGGMRISLQFYNTKEEIDYFFEKIDNFKF